MGQTSSTKGMPGIGQTRKTITYKIAGGKKVQLSKNAAKVPVVSAALVAKAVLSSQLTSADQSLSSSAFADQQTPDGGTAGKQPPATVGLSTPPEGTTAGLSAGIIQSNGAPEFDTAVQQTLSVGGSGTPTGRGRVRVLLLSGVHR